MGRREDESCKREFRECVKKTHNFILGYMYYLDYIYVQVILSENANTYTYKEGVSQKVKKRLNVYHLAQLIETDSPVFLVVSISTTITVSNFPNLCVGEFEL